MPQLDQFIFLHQVVTLIIFFFLLYAYIRRNLIPKLNDILKYRTKQFDQLWRFEKGHWSLYNKSNRYYERTDSGWLHRICWFIGLAINHYNKMSVVDYKLKKINIVLNNSQKLKIENYKHETLDILATNVSSYYLNTVKI